MRHPQHPKCLQNEGLGFQNPVIRGLLNPKALEYEVLVLVDVQVMQRHELEASPKNRGLRKNDLNKQKTQRLFVNLEGPSTLHLRCLVPRTIDGMVFVNPETIPF